MILRRAVRRGCHAGLIWAAGPVRALVLGGLLCGILVLGTPWPTFAAPGFVPGIDDMPLMPGLRAVPDAVVFDKPTGRIVQAVAAGEGLTVAMVRRFYDRSLPELGWRATGAQAFEREGERLILEIEGDPKTGGVTVRFDIAPR